MEYIFAGIFIVCMLSCPIFFYYAAKSYFEYYEFKKKHGKDAKSSKIRRDFVQEVSVSGKNGYKEATGTVGYADTAPVGSVLQVDAKVKVAKKAVKKKAAKKVTKKKVVKKKATKKKAAKKKA